MKFPFSTHVFYAKLNIIVKRCSFIANIVFGNELQARTSEGNTPNILQMWLLNCFQNDVVFLLKKHC